MGAAGFLQGRRATTHPSVYKELEPYCGEVSGKEWSMKATS
jgi:transcriptional regulator GlxA family with amidase domain